MGKVGSAKNFRKSNLTLNPKAFTRRSNLSSFGAGHNKGFMAPNAGGALAGLGNIITRTSAKDTPAFSGGIASRMGAVQKLERRAAKNASSKAVLRGDLNLARIAKMNATPGSLTTTTKVAQNLSPFAGTAHASIVAPTTTVNNLSKIGSSAISIQTTPLGGLINKAAVGQTLSIGERRALATAGVRGTISKSFLEYSLLSGGGLDFMSSKTLGATAKTFGTGTLTLTENAEKVVRGLAKGIHGNAQFGVNVANKLGMAMPMTELGAAKMSQQLLAQGITKTLGVKGTAQAIKYGGAKVGMAVGARAIGMALPGINLIFAADMAYQLAKLGGKAIKGGINFGKAGMRSMEGSMYGGMFGGYKDDEVRATSRARGVSAIQNSRLNARSLLGSEGAMMAAHFG